ncbi:hypothetical protein C4F40_01290 [Sphingobacterium sp. Ka21]|uniref:DUF1304 domain-containing protein n=1 Tax=Sphingobacterium pedocola TaxID=2082722 RepID=A0ABR9T206_9SPHI|nr:hypothetical protein [Sphingobacterium pedocola]
MIIIAQYGLIIILSVFLVFHFLIILKIIPYSIVWSGRLKSDKEMYRFETVSILINLFFLLIILVQSSFLAIDFPRKVMTILLWIMTALFLFNTFGNAISKDRIEQRLFTPITILLTLFSLILALTN